MRIDLEQLAINVGEIKAAIRYLQREKCINQEKAESTLVHCNAISEDLDGFITELGVIYISPTHKEVS